MKKVLLAALVATAFAAPIGGAIAAGPCGGPVAVDCDYCVDYLGRRHPPEFCQPGNPDTHWVHCTLWVMDQCVVH